MSKLKVDLQGILNDQNEKVKEEQEQLLQESGLNEIKGLLEYDQARHNEIINHLGGSSVNMMIQDIQAKKIQLEQDENFYGGKVFTEEQVKGLCLDYKLKFLSSNVFKGNLDIRVVEKITELEKTLHIGRATNRAKVEGITLEQYLAKEDTVPFKFSAHDLKTRFFIMAPPAMFNLTVRPKPAKIRKIVDYDPILFYEIDTPNGEEKKYRIVHKWGQDFTIARAVKGFVFRSEANLMLIVTLAIMATLFLCLSAFTNLYVNGTMFKNILFIVATIVVSPILAIIFLPKSDSDNYSEVGWNTPFKS